MSEWFDSEEKQQLEKLRRQVNYEKYKAEQNAMIEAETRRRESQESYEETASLMDEIEELKQAVGNLESRLDRIEAFLRVKHLEEWDCFEAKKT